MVLSDAEAIIVDYIKKHPEKSGHEIRRSCYKLIGKIGYLNPGKATICALNTLCFDGIIEIKNAKFVVK